MKINRFGTANIFTFAGPVMAAILNFWKNEHMGFCCLSMGNMHNVKEKDPAHRCIRAYILTFEGQIVWSGFHTYYCLFAIFRLNSKDLVLKTRSCYS